MRLKQVDLNLFVVFNAIYEKRNLTRAAEVLCITQPSVSNALSRLRKTLNDPLFISTPQGMVPTPVTENIIGRVGEALNLLDSSLIEGDSFDSKSADKTFKISLSDLAAASYLPKLGEILQQIAPDIHIESYQGDRKALTRELSVGGLDLAIDAPIINDPQLCHVALSAESYACMVRKDHPLANQKLSLDSYLSLGHIHVSSRRVGLGYVDTKLAAMGEQRKIQVRAQHYMVAPLIAMRTDFALTAPRSLLREYDATLLELPFDLPATESHLYWHRSADQDKANKWLREIIIKLNKTAL